MFVLLDKYAAYSIVQLILSVSHSHLKPPGDKVDQQAGTALKQVTYQSGVAGMPDRERSADAAQICWGHLKEHL